jgi:rhamnose utilization protein RhaD (predicted bifunctional aldolase and dehydrogenase)
MLNNDSLNLSRLKDLSFQIGTDNDLIQATGGNTSFKNNKILWVKASGKELKKAKVENIFVPLDLSSEISKNNFLSLNLNSIDPNINLRPSIETSLHAIIPSKFVIHTHPLDLIAHTVLPESKNFFKNTLSGYKWNWIEYVKPGVEIAKKIIKFNNKDESQIYILENHGLIISGNNHIELLDIQYDIFKRIKIQSREIPEVNFNLLNKLLKFIQNKGIQAKLPRFKSIHSLAIDKLSFDLANKNPLFPDQVVFSGLRPLVCKEKDLLEQSNLNYSDRQYLIIENVGVIMLNNYSLATEDILLAQSKINLKIKEPSRVKTLTNIECNQLIDWEAEIYRKNIAK